MKSFKQRARSITGVKRALNRLDPEDHPSVVLILLNMFGVGGGAQIIGAAVQTTQPASCQRAKVGAQ